MTLVAIPNISAGRDPEIVALLTEEIRDKGAHVLDVHADPDHDRTVVTVSGPQGALVSSMVALAQAAAQAIDLTEQSGAHPRVGGLDVCPFVPHSQAMETAVGLAHKTGRRIASAAGLPVYFYGEAALRSETRSLPDIRRGGLEELGRRAKTDLPPDAGPVDVDPRRGVVCVGARAVLVAFNIWLDCDLETAGEIARSIRTSSGGLPGVRALGLPLPSRSLSQISMNLVDPETTGIDRAFDAVARTARALDAAIVATEMVGLVPERFLPDPNTQAARLLVEPGRSLESALRA